MTVRRDAIAAAVSMLYPNAGSCAFCGLPDKRHRLFEDIQENLRAGDSAALVADAYDVPRPVVEAIGAAARPTRRDWEQLGSIQP